MSNLKNRWEIISKEIEESIEYKIESISIDVAIQFYKQMKKLGINKKELAKRLGVSKSYVTQLLNGKSNMTIETLIKVAEALNLNLQIKLVPKKLDSEANVQSVKNQVKKAKSKGLLLDVK